jgi:hypothetical protein
VPDCQQLTQLHNPQGEVIITRQLHVSSDIRDDLLKLQVALACTMKQTEAMMLGDHADMSFMLGNKRRQHGVRQEYICSLLGYLD